MALQQTPRESHSTHSYNSPNNASAARIAAVGRIYSEGYIPREERYKALSAAAYDAVNITSDAVNKVIH